MSKYNAIKAYCLENKVLFEDTEFPNEEEKLLYDWKRPKDIVDNPKFITDGISRFDVKQGKLADCWFVSSVVSLTLQPKYLYQVVPKEQSFDENYCGIFYFRFWQFERWVDVIIDDRLPTYQGCLSFMRSNDPNEFWSALLEKAYAKLFGSYKALVSGNTAEAMQDFTGGVTERLTVCPEDADNVLQLITNTLKKTPFVSASINGALKPERNDGLLGAHAYSVIQIENITLISNETELLVKLRNPWGCSEWTGRWSDSSACWETVALNEKERIGVLEAKEDGEFFMSFQDFINNFNELEICYTHPSDMICVNDNTGISSMWKLRSFHGKWIEGVTAGGCMNNPELYLLNPKYIIKLNETESEVDNANLSMVVSLTQKNRRSKNRDKLTLGFTLHKLSEEELEPSYPKLNAYSLLKSKPISSIFMNNRQICKSIKLEAGVYCVVPCTFKCDEEGEFLLRIYSECTNQMMEPDETKMDTFGSEQMLLQMENNELQKATAEAIVLFKAYSGEDNEIEVDELKELLNTVLQEDMATGFSEDMCKSIVAIKDEDLSGKLEIDEFKHLWADIHASKLIFNKKKTGDILEARDINAALSELGFVVSKRVLNVLVLRYGSVKRQIKFDDFLLCVIRLKNMTTIYRQKFFKTQALSLDEWLENTMYL